jgi:hypothetical protein
MSNEERQKWPKMRRQRSNSTKGAPNGKSRFNPVKHGYVERAVDWPYSSIHREIENSNVSENLGCFQSDIESVML